MVKIGLIVLSLVFFYVPAFAQTPDGETPANEGTCDTLFGGTPGLYGLCVAYCEAQDCTDENVATGQCGAPNPRVLANYNKRKLPSDPDMPCVKASCPCWTEAELANLPAPMAGDGQGCRKDFIGGSHLNLDSFARSTDLPERRITTVQTTQLNDGSFRCGIQDECNEGDCLQRNIFLEITPAQFATCETQLNEAGAALGYACFTGP